MAALTKPHKKGRNKDYPSDYCPQMTYYFQIITFIMYKMCNYLAIHVYCEEDEEGEGTGDTGGEMAREYCPVFF